jgi:uncharacterized membrane protein
VRLCAYLCDDVDVPTRKSIDRPRALGLSLIVGSLLGLLAAFALTVEKFAVLEHPARQLSCNISVLIGCGASLSSEQGALLGFPNSLLGLVFWSAVAVVGVVVVWSELPRGMWLLLAVGMTGALALVVWFIFQSIYVIGVLCPWCMLTWVETIPLFFLVVLHGLRSGAVPAPRVVRAAARRLYSWVPVLSALAVVVIAVLAQARLDVLHSL